MVADFEKHGKTKDIAYGQKQSECPSQTISEEKNQKNNELTYHLCAWGLERVLIIWIEKQIRTGSIYFNQEGGIRKRFIRP